MKSSDLAEPVKAIADTQQRGRQYLASYVSGLAGTHAGGFVLTRQEAAGKWSAATYVLKRTMFGDGIGHRTHRTRRVGSTGIDALCNGSMFGGDPMPPMSPMPDAVDDEVVPAGKMAKI